jgi:uncharacterized damage-inducible protein DinB
VNGETRSPSPQAIAPAAAQIAHLLHQLASVIDALSDGDYQAEHAREVSGSVGGHVRHCLDHVSALVAGLPSRCIGYDARARGTEIERRRDAAVREARRLAEALASVRVESTDMDVCVDIRPHADRGAGQVVRSTFGRELAFVASHTVHHFAIVALLLRDMGIGVPRRFGYAPSTPSPELAA